MKWIKLTDKEPKFGEKYLLLNSDNKWFSGELRQKLENETGKTFVFKNNELLEFEEGTSANVSNITHYMKIELPK